MTCLILLLCQAGETAFLSVAAKGRKQREPLELFPSSSSKLFSKHQRGHRGWRAGSLNPCLIRGSFCEIVQTALHRVEVCHLGMSHCHQALYF